MKKGMVVLCLSFLFVAIGFVIQHGGAVADKGEFTRENRTFNEVQKETSLTIKEIPLEEKLAEPKKEYTIVHTEEIDLGFEVRNEIWIVPDNIFLQAEEIKKISLEVIEKEKEAKIFPAMDVFFIDDKRQVHNGFTIARVSYERPNKYISVGDYEGYIYSEQIGSAESELLPRDYPEGTYPTKEELDIYFYWLERMNSGIEEENAFIETAQTYGLSPEKTKEVVERAKSR